MFVNRRATKEKDGASRPKKRNKQGLFKKRVGLASQFT